MAEMKYYVRTPQGRVMGPMTAGDRGNHVAAGCQEVSAEEAQQQAQRQQPAQAPRPVRREQPPAAAEGSSA